MKNLINIIMTVLLLIALSTIFSFVIGLIVTYVQCLGVGGLCGLGFLGLFPMLSVEFLIILTCLNQAKNHNFPFKSTSNSKLIMIFFSLIFIPILTIIWAFLLS